MPETCSAKPPHTSLLFNSPPINSKKILRKFTSGHHPSACRPCRPLRSLAPEIQIQVVNTRRALERACLRLEQAESLLDFESTYRLRFRIVKPYFNECRLTLAAYTCAERTGSLLSEIHSLYEDVLALVNIVDSNSSSWKSLCLETVSPGHGLGFHLAERIECSGLPENGILLSLRPNDSSCQRS